MDFFDVLTLFGGIALFLFGMNYMGDSLKRLSGSKLEGILAKLTSNRFKGFFLGLGVTAAIQSSSAVMVMLVGFVNSGIMKLAQTTSILMGANIGTTVTAWLLSTSGIKSGGVAILDLFKPSSFTPLFAVIGILMTMIAKSDKKKNIGSILLGFAILMFGMSFMSDATSGLKESATFQAILTKFSNPIAGILVGTAFTAIIQSSSASVGILQALALASDIPMEVALPVILGMNIGAAVPPIISALSGNVHAKRVAANCVYIKIIGVVVVTTVFYILHMMLDFNFMHDNSTVFTIAIVHTTFNVISTVILMPFCGLIEKLCEITFKATVDDDMEEENDFAELDDRFLAFPGFAVEKSRELTGQMAEIAKKAVVKSIGMIGAYSDKDYEKVARREKSVDGYEDKLGSYLVELAGRELNKAESTEVTALLHIIGDVERISDHACNIADTAKELEEKGIRFSDEALAELNTMEAAIGEILELAEQAIKTNDASIAMRIEPLEQVVDKLRYQMKNNHIERLQNSECTIEFGFVFSDLLTNFERISDHCSNIAVYLLQQGTPNFVPHEYMVHVKDGGNDNFNSLYDVYNQKYSID